MKRLVDSSVAEGLVEEWLRALHRAVCSSEMRVQLLTKADWLCRHDFVLSLQAHQKAHALKVSYRGCVKPRIFKVQNSHSSKLLIGGKRGAIAPIQECFEHCMWVLGVKRRVEDSRTCNKHGAKGLIHVRNSQEGNSSDCLLRDLALPALSVGNAPRGINCDNRSNGLNPGRSGRNEKLTRPLPTSHCNKRYQPKGRYDHQHANHVNPKAPFLFLVHFSISFVSTPRSIAQGED